MESKVLFVDAPEIHTILKRNSTICSPIFIRINVLFVHRRRPAHLQPVVFRVYLHCCRRAGKKSTEWGKDKQYSNKHVKSNDVLHLIVQSVHGTWAAIAITCLFSIFLPLTLDHVCVIACSRATGGEKMRLGWGTKSALTHFIRLSASIRRKSDDSERIFFCHQHLQASRQWLDVDARRSVAKNAINHDGLRPHKRRFIWIQSWLSYHSVSQKGN